jgi:hypothetical protein
MPAKPEINLTGKIISGILLISFTALSILTIIGFWPDRLPQRGHEDGIYRMKLFHVTLDTSTTTPSEYADTLVIKPVEKKPDSLNQVFDSITTANDSQASARQGTPGPKKPPLPALDIKRKKTCTININTLLMVLVAAAGFLGNMIHIATSFTTYVGAEKFKKSWLLWYFVRPVTAAGLAMVLYFVFRAGFLNYSNDSSNLNLYGVLTLSVFAGLFTDIATQKLKEVFETVFKPKDQRPDKLDNEATGEGKEFTVTDISPAKLDKIKSNKIIITGANLDKAKANVVIGDTIVSQVVITAGKMEFDYAPTPEEALKSLVLLVITDENGKALYTKKIPFA